MNELNNAHMLGTADMRRHEMNYRRGVGRRYQALQAAANGNLAPMEAYQREVEALALSAARTAVKEKPMEQRLNEIEAKLDRLILLMEVQIRFSLA